jgi:cell division septation protein DedD
VERKTSKIQKRGDMTKEIQRHYKTLKIKPDATVEEVRQAYEYLSSAWDVDRFTDNPDWRKRAEAKLAEISTAYEKIVDFMNNDIRDLPVEMPLDAPEPRIPLSENKIRVVFTKKIKAILLATAAAVLFGIFIWPTAYDHDSMKSGDRVYSIRTNRITGQASYLDGGQWKPMPFPQVRKVPDVKAMPKKAETAAPEKVPVAAETTAAQKKEKTEPAKPAAPPVETKKALPPAQAETEKKPYAVQIAAIRDGEKARTIVNQLKRGGFDAHMAKVTVKDQGIIYRIFLGRFAAREKALKHLTDKKIKDQYPGSFVQKITP